MTGSECYQIRVKGHLDSRWSGWFDGLTITQEGSGETMLSGPIPDQAALYGVLAKIRDLGLPLLLVSRVERDSRYRNSSGHLVELRQVVKTYQSAAGPFTALKGVNLKVDAGEFVAVIGKSGSGKSTLVNMITGIDRPTAGEVLVGDTAIHTLSEGELAVWRGRNVGIIFQFFQLLPTLTVVENVMLPMDFCGRYAPGARLARARRLLGQVEMAEHADKLPSALSGGQRQRVAIARALANDPPLLLADEPTGNLDSRTAGSVFQLFQNLVERGKTIIVVTHDHDLARRVTHTVRLADGELAGDVLNPPFRRR